MTDLANEHAERQAHWNENKHNELRSVGVRALPRGRVTCVL